MCFSVVNPLRCNAGGREQDTKSETLSSMLAGLRSPVLFAGDARTAYRDPTALYHKGWFYVYFTLLRTEEDGVAYSFVAWTKSRDLRTWTPPVTITPRDKRFDYGSPGDVIRAHGRWILCLQTYPRPHGEKYGNGSVRLWTMTSHDLETWGTPELIRVKGPQVPEEKMGRMIDPFLLADKDERHKWWCFYKQDGVSISYSNDLTTWTPYGHTNAGENPCVIVDQDEYVLFDSPPNGIGMQRSKDLKVWRDEGVTVLGQSGWPWAQGRITAGFVLDLRKDSRVRKALMFFHGSTYPEADPRGGFDNFASFGWRGVMI